MMKTLKVLILCWCLLPFSAVAEMYRWIDSKGNTYYTDQIPPSAVGFGHTEFNRSGTPVSREKSAEELALEQRLAKEKAEKASLQKEKIQRDNQLLRNYADVLELVTAYENRLSMQKSNLQQLRLVRSKIAIQIVELEEQRENNIDETQLERLAAFTQAARESLLFYDKAIEQGLSEIVVLREQYQEDKERLQQLLDQQTADKLQKEQKGAKLELEPT